MGNCFSDPSKHKQPSGGQKLGSAPGPKQQQQPQQPQSQSLSGRPTGSTLPPQALGGPSSAGDARDNALKAAEERAKATKSKGVHTSNPKAGKLSAKLEAERKSPPPAGAQNDERLMDRGQWN